eukprot:CAMPEP_0194222794 /NCGR_PEP_ID=MMETSP0156-20130528/33767_1 /TAXON_ID=33649 /ORGANISM="Thalassionema nitzschioides, Strain L26-B" /LENGTH=576 /DNA_ID=CAMNT_0038953729 /DNA_START=114 /DNA_END=1847 /DNA_ORIENTATION=+
MILISLTHFVFMTSLRHHDFSLSIPRDCMIGISNRENMIELDIPSNATLLELQDYRDRTVALKQQINESEARLPLLQQRIDRISNVIRKAEMKISLDIAAPIGILEDDFSTGKSCQKIASNWECRDCLDGSKEWKSCALLQPHTRCQSWDAKPLDEPTPRRQTYHDDNAFDDGLRYALQRMDQRGSYEQFPCLELQDCFDMSKCQNGTSPLKIFIYNERSGIGDRIERELQQRLQNIVVVTPPSEACLFIVTPRSFAKMDYVKLINSSYWNEGRNHFLFQSHWILNHQWDRFLSDENFHRAALSGPNFYQGSVRIGFDIPLYYDHPQKRFVVNDTTYRMVKQLHRVRPYLLSFQGTIKPISVWFFHRWLASAYWPKNDPTIRINVRCPMDNVTMGQNNDYLEVILASTFVFCPGGRSPGSWRFGETLALGGIPVVTTDFVPPFYPDVDDWEKCILTVNAARIIALPQIVKNITEEEIRSRQIMCMKLFQKLIGWTRSAHSNDEWQIDVDGASFTAALRLWKQRLEIYSDELEGRKSLMKAIKVGANTGVPTGVAKNLHILSVRPDSSQAVPGTDAT